MLPPELFKRLNLPAAVERELTARNRLLPRRWDHLALASNTEAVEKWLRPRLRKNEVGSRGDVVFADKGWRGTRPLNVMTLEDRVLYRALVDLLSTALPERLSQRTPIEEFRRAPLDIPDTAYISKTDINAYYVYVDHELLADELIAQTGDELAVTALAGLLEGVMGRRVGLPQIHEASNVLGDTYIDPVRRRLLRSGYSVFTYSDDFRIASPSLGSARGAIEACSIEVSRLGLVLNERKTYTYGAENYRESLDSFAKAEQRLFTDQNHSAADLFLLREGYDDDGPESEPLDSFRLGDTPIGSDIDENEATTDVDEPQPAMDDESEHRAEAAKRAWRLWIEEEETEDAQSRRDAAITQSLLDRALPALGAAGNREPLRNLDSLLRFEPALTPQIASYLSNYGATGQRARSNIRTALDDIVEQDIFSTWQGMWLAQSAGNLIQTAGTRKHIDWLVRCVHSGPDALAATAAASLGRLRQGEPDVLAAAIDRVGPEWRQLVLRGLGWLDPVKAAECAEHELDRLMLEANGQ